MKAKLIFLISLGIASVSAQSIIEDAKKDLLVSQKMLTEQRQQYNTEQITLASEVTQLRFERDKKIRQIDLSRKSTEAKKRLLDELKGKEYASSLAISELNQMVKTYGLQLETKLLPGEPDEPRLEALYAESNDLNSLLEKRLAVIDAGIDRLEQSIGGRISPATAADEDSKVIKGTVAHFGPLSWFTSDDQAVAGQYIIAPSGQVASLSKADKDSVISLVQGKEATLNIDITGGKATALAAIKQNPLEMIKKGGAWIYPILGIAAFAFISAILKFFQLLRLKHQGSEWTQQISDHYINGDIEAAHQLASSANHPVSQVLPECIHAIKSGIDVAEEVLYEKMIAVRGNLRTLLPFIAITAATAPMLGLLGTVSGLIRTFSVITVEGTGEAQSISGGISEALITTLFGLAVAIPSFIAHALLSRRAKGIEQTTERIALRFINHVRMHQK